MNAHNVIITGAAKGIGAACTAEFLEQGYNVLAVDIDSQSLQALQDKHQTNRLYTAEIDIGTPEAPKAITQLMNEQFGAVGVLVNNAGIAPKRAERADDITNISYEEWSRIIHINLSSAAFLCQAALRDMAQAGWGRIINVASSGGRTRALGPVGPAYMASKAGMLGLTRNIASEMGKKNITANVVAPGRIDTTLSATSGASVTQEYAKLVPVGRTGKPHEVAAAVVFLASKKASFITGACIDVNGGMFML